MLKKSYETIQKHEGVLGTIGVVYHTPTSYHPMHRVGWAEPNEKTERVDIVGHAWFFKREWLSTFWRELPEEEFKDFIPPPGHFLWDHLLSFKRLPRFPFIHLL